MTSIENRLQSTDCQRVSDVKFSRASERRTWDREAGLTVSSLELRVDRNRGFTKRLNSACDNKQAPPYNSGRLVWLRQQLAQKFNVSVSMESVRTWFAGEALPSPERAKTLAELLETDLAWLMYGQEADLTPRERRLRNAEADGVVNVVAGFVQMQGGHPAFPGDVDRAALTRHVDLYAVIRGAQYAFHVVLAESLESGEEFRFSVPADLDSDVFVIGVVPTGGFSVDLVELDSETLTAEGVRRGGALVLSVRRRGDDYVTAASILSRIEGFNRRL